MGTGTKVRLYRAEIQDRILLPVMRSGRNAKKIPTLRSNTCSLPKAKTKEKKLEISRTLLPLLFQPSRHLIMSNSSAHLKEIPWRENLLCYKHIGMTQT